METIFEKPLDKEVASLNDHIANKSKINYVDIDITNDVGIQVNSASGGVVNWGNFIGGFVINTNNIVALFYTYSNLIYVRLKNVDTLAQPSAGNYKVRILYYS